jgi:hypothetical protein
VDTVGSWELGYYPLDMGITGGREIDVVRPATQRLKPSGLII